MSDFFKQARKSVAAGLNSQSSDEQIVQQHSVEAPQEPHSTPTENINTNNQKVHSMPENNVNSPSDLPSLPFKMTGNIPPEIMEAIKEKQELAAKAKFEVQKQTTVENKTVVASQEYPSELNIDVPPDPVRKYAAPPTVNVQKNDDAYENVLALINQKYIWEEFSFPSKSKFYKDIPEVIHIRPMTGEEEQILASPRHVKSGKAMDMIFERCIREKINTRQLLSVDRTYLLIFLRGISYTPEYDVEMKCSNCSTKFGHTIDLNDLEVEACPNDFSFESLKGVTPVTHLEYRYRLATGEDDNIVNSYREKKIAQYGDQSDDDTLLYRTALLLENLHGVVIKSELTHLLKKLHIMDVSHLRNEINNPPFGVKTELEILCPACSETFKVDLPLETNFFFPRKKTAKTPQ